MIRIWRDEKIVGRARQEARGMVRLSPWLFAGLLIAALLWHGTAPTLAGVFQSEIPTPTTLPEASPTASVPTIPPPTDTPAPSLASSPTPAVIASATPGGIASPAPEAVASATPIPSETSAALPTASSPAMATPKSLPTAREKPANLEESSNPESGSSAFLGSLALALAYTWLICGSLLLIALAVLFLFLWRAGKRSRQEDK